MIFIGLPSPGLSAAATIPFALVLPEHGDSREPSAWLPRAAHAVQSSRNHGQTGSAAPLQGTRHTRHCYRPARMAALSSIQDPARHRLPPSASRTGSARKASFRRGPRLCVGLMEVKSLSCQLVSLSRKRIGDREFSHCPSLPLPGTGDGSRRCIGAALFLMDSAHAGGLCAAGAKSNIRLQATRDHS